jgi:hypothetical protein
MVLERVHRKAAGRKRESERYTPDRVDECTNWSSRVAAHSCTFTHMTYAWKKRAIQKRYHVRFNTSGNEFRR